MDIILSQSMDGSWKLSKIKHNKSGLVITGATVSYKGKTLSLPDIKSTQTTTQLPTGWNTKVGMSDSEVRAMENEINGSFAPNPVIVGNTAYTVVAKFTCVPFIPVEPVHTYSLTVEPSATEIESNGKVALKAKFFIDSTPTDVTTAATWVIEEGAEYAAVGNTTTKKGGVSGTNVTSSVQTVKVKATYTYDNKSYSATSTIRVRGTGSISTSTSFIEFECEADEYVVTVNAGSLAWSVRVSEGDSWVSVQDKTSSGFIVKVLDNEGQTRNGKIVVSPDQAGAAEPVEIRVKQKQCEVEPSIEIISVDGDLEVGCGELGPFRYDISASADWSVDSNTDYPWIMPVKNNGKLSITLEENDGEDRNGEVTVYLTDNPTVKDTLSIKQLKCVPQTLPEIDIIFTSSSVLGLVGGTVEATITVTDGTFTDITMNPNVGISYNVNSIETDGNVQTVKVTFIVETTNQERDFTVTANGEDDYGRTCNDSEKIEQVWADWILSDVDYILFTYEWAEGNGRDLDSFTYVDGIPRTSLFYEKGVGYGNGNRQDNGDGDDYERWVGPSYDDAILKFAGDNLQTGGEYTLVNLKKLNEYIKSLGPSQQSSKVIVYLMGSWYNVKKDGNSTISFSAFTGGEMIRVKESGNKYRYEPANGSILKDKRSEPGIYVFAASHSQSPSTEDPVGASGKGIKNYSFPISHYTTMAALVYDLEKGVFYLVTGDRLKNDSMFSGRYSYGLESYFLGQWTVTDANGLETTTKYSPSATVYPKALLTAQREYTAEVNATFHAITGNSLNNPHEVQVSLKNIHPKTEYSDAALTVIDDKTFKVNLNGSGKFYGSDYRVLLTIQNPDNDEYMARIIYESSPTYLDINEKDIN